MREDAKRTYFDPAHPSPVETGDYPGRTLSCERCENEATELFQRSADWDES